MAWHQIFLFVLGDEESCIGSLLVFCGALCLEGAYGCFYGEVIRSVVGRFFLCGGCSTADIGHVTIEEGIDGTLIWRGGMSGDPSCVLGRRGARPDNKMLAIHMHDC
jgi:hypothetical protein